MRRQLTLMTIGVATSLILGFNDSSAAVQFSAGLTIHAQADFYNPLAPMGAWVQVGRYGRCWHPAAVAVGWRPYCNGEWQWTDAGWYWDSDEPWSWACYHYGYWVEDPSYGWVWVPGTEWAPAWVVWCQGPEYIGWAPCGPNFAVPAASFFVFVGINRFHGPFNERDLIIGNPTIFRQTTIVRNSSRETRTIGGVRQTIVVNRGPGVDAIQRATRTTFTARPIEQAARPTRAPANLRSDYGTSREPVQRETPRSTTGRGETRTYETPHSPAREATPRREPSEPAPRTREAPQERPSPRERPQAAPERTPAPAPSERTQGAQRPPVRPAPEHPAHPAPEHRPEKQPGA